MTIIIISGIVALLSIANFIIMILVDKRIAENGGESIFWEERK